MRPPSVVPAGRGGVRLIEWNDVTVETNGQHFFGDQFLYREPTFFDVFSFKFRSGGAARPTR